MIVVKYYLIAIIGFVSLIPSSPFLWFKKLRSFSDNKSKIDCKGVKVTSSVNGCSDLHHCLRYRASVEYNTVHLGCDEIIYCYWSDHNWVNIVRADCAPCEPPEKCSRPKLIYRDIDEDCHNSEDFTPQEHVCGTKNLKNPALDAPKFRKGDNETSSPQSVETTTPPSDPVKVEESTTSRSEAAETTTPPYIPPVAASGPMDY